MAEPTTLRATIAGLLAVHTDHLNAAIRGNTITGLPEVKPGMACASGLLRLHKEQLLADVEPQGVRLLLDAMTAAFSAEDRRCPRCGRSLADYPDDEIVFRADDPRPYCSGECVVAAQLANPEEEREDLLTTYRQMVTDEEFAPRGSLVDGALRFLLGEIDRLRAQPVPYEQLADRLDAEHARRVKAAWSPTEHQAAEEWSSVAGFVRGLAREQQAKPSGVIAYSPGGRTLRCPACRPNPLGSEWRSLTAEDLEDGGICTACGVDVLIAEVSRG